MLKQKCFRAISSISLIVTLGVLLPGFIVSAHADDDQGGGTFKLGPTGLGVEGSRLLIATRLTNQSDDDVAHVRIEAVVLDGQGGTSIRPISIQAIKAGETTVIQASVSADGLNPGQRYELQVYGDYAPASDWDHARAYDGDHAHPSDWDHAREFRVKTPVIIPKAGPGSGDVQTNQVPPRKVSGGSYPPVPQTNDFDEANEFVPPIPTGRLRSIQPAQGTAPQRDPPGASVAFNANDKLNLSSGGSNGTASSTAEPSGASNGAGVILATTNWTVDYSTDGGGTFTQLDPTTIFPNDAIGYCCDQIVQYVPSIDRFILLLQGGGGYRVASASPADVKSSGATSWTYWNLSQTFFGFTGGLDYPDLSVGTDYLYLSFDEVGTGLAVARISLAAIAAGGTVTVEWTDPTNGGPAYGGHVMQNTGNEVFWAGHNSTSQMRIFSWAEGSGTYFWRDVNIGSWSNTGLSSTTPDGQDFLTKLSNFPDNAVIGATRAAGPPSPGADESFSDGLWFAWSAGTDSNFAQPHIEMVTLDRSNNFALVQQVQIWNSSFTYAYPALSTNACTGEVGFSIEGGGSGTYENLLVGFWGDYVAYITTNSSVGTTRYGDYVTIRQDPTPALNGAFFDAFGYGLNSPQAGQSGPQTDARYIQFGRSGACQVQVR